MEKKIDTAVSREIYSDALKQLGELPDSLVFGDDDSVVYKRSECPYSSGSHRIRSRFGGYGTLCYQKHLYGELEICIGYSTDCEHPVLEITMPSVPQVKAVMKVQLTRELWSKSDLFSELKKAHEAISLDYASAVEKNDFKYILSRVPCEHKEWSIGYIISVRDSFFHSSPAAKEIEEKKSGLIERLTQLDREYIRLEGAHEEESSMLENELRETYL